MLGQRRSGKSIASWKLTEYLLPKFDLVLSFLGTRNCNKELCSLIGNNFDERLNFVEFNENVLKKLMEQQEDIIADGRRRDVLIVFDDVFASSTPKNVELLTRLFIRGRHFHISIINAAVCFTTVQKNCRRCLDIMFLFSSVCKSDNQILSSEYIHNNVSTAQYALQNLPEYTALVIESKRNQKLFQFKFQLENDRDEHETVEVPDGIQGLEEGTLEFHEIQIPSSKSNTDGELPGSDNEVLV
jgi:hypothetical protein